LNFSVLNLAILYIIHEREVLAMIITATEFRNRVGKYLKAAQNDDIIISKNGKHIAKLTALKEDDYPATQNLIGVFEKAPDYSIKDVKHEKARLHNH